MEVLPNGVNGFNELWWLHWHKYPSIIKNWRIYWQENTASRHFNVKHPYKLYPSRRNLSQTCVGQVSVWPTLQHVCGRVFVSVIVYAFKVYVCIWFCVAVTFTIPPGTEELAAQPFPWNPGSRKTNQRACIHLPFLLMELIDRTEISHTSATHGFLSCSSSAGPNFGHRVIHRSEISIPGGKEEGEKNSPEI